MGGFGAQQVMFRFNLGDGNSELLLQAISISFFCTFLIDVRVGKVIVSYGSGVVSSEILAKK